MRQSRLHCGRVAWLLVSGLLIGVPAIGQQTPSDNAEIIHVLNRISFGPRPGDVEAVKQIGLHNYIERQLHPETIDDSAVEQELGKFNLLQMTSEQLTQMYIEIKLKKHSKDLQPDQPKMADNDQDQTAPHAVAGTDQNPAQNPGDFQHQGKKQRVPGQAGGGGTYAAADQLEQAKLVRAVDSKRQLQEVLVDFWSNHFNIDVKKGPDAVFKVVDDRDVIRPHIWGKFRDLLEASAKSPAMLFYLDNVNSTVARTISPAQRQMQESNQQELFGTAAPVHPPFKTKEKGGGINENYAREIMELHTLGVDAGYTQQDVQEIARCFTGWSIDRPSGTFTFHAFAHDNGPKVVLGHHIPAGGGIQDGETVLDILCAHPACAHFISRELCQRFVADDPPAALVDRIADVFTKTGGDLRQVTEAILTSPEFLSPADYGNKIKSPLEFTVSAIRASDSTILAKTGPSSFGDNKFKERMAQYGKQPLDARIGELGEPLFSCVPPTGYGEVSKKWVSPGALIERLNFATALTQQELSDIRFDPEKILVGTDLDKPGTVLDQCVAKLLQGNITENTRKVLEQNALPAPGSNQTVDPTKLIALIIGSPEFQRK